MPDTCKVYVVTHHPGVREWLKHWHPDLSAHARFVPEWTVHMTPALSNGDIVIGFLPASTVAQICGFGGRFMSLELPYLSERLQGKALEIIELIEAGARLLEISAKFVEIVQSRPQNS